MFGVKENADGSLSKYKVWLVAKGFHQKQGFDLKLSHKLSNPVTVRIVLTQTLWPGSKLVRLIFPLQNFGFKGTQMRPLFVYVDDIIITGSSNSPTQHLIPQLDFVISQTTGFS